MDIKIVKNLVNILENSSLNKLEIEDTEGETVTRILLEKSAALSPSAVAQPVIIKETTAAPLPAETPVRVDGSSEGVLDYNLVEEITSPMVGIYYASPSPDAPVFVTKGKRVHKGDTLCIIEAMKLMNEVVAERDGEIVEVCASNGSLVEFGQVLFKIF